MKKRFVAAYSKNKVVRTTVKVIGILIAVGVILLLITFPITNRKFNLKFENLTRDEGFEAIGQINVDEVNSVKMAKQAFLYNINQIEQLEPPRSTMEIVFRFNAGKAYRKQQEYLTAYRKFYDSPYWNYWEEIEKQYHEIKAIEDKYDKAEKEYNTEIYKTTRTIQLYNEMETINDQKEKTNKEMDRMYEQQEREYKLFTDHLYTLYEKYY